MLRIGALTLNFGMIVVMEYYYLRESLLQAACFQKGLCTGGSSFNQLMILKDMRITDGLILVNGEISYGWMQANFWRAFIVVTIHYINILALI